MDGSVEPRRKVISPPRDENGLFIQPRDVGPEREQLEHLNRLNFAEHFHYADETTGNTRTFDPEGNYVCGGCNKKALATDGFGLDDKDCLLIPIDVDPKAGSCEHWENTCAGDREINLRGIISALEAVYGIAKNGKGFGCHRCPFQEKAFAADSRGRDRYCRKGDFRVPWNACCALNGAAMKPLSEALLNRKIDDHDGKGDSVRADLERAMAKAEK